MKDKPVLLVTGAPSRPGRRVVELPLERKTTMQNILLIESSPLGFIGITDVDVVRVEGVAVSGIGPEKALALATTQSKQIATHLA
jgi:hypothetical protein